MRSRTLPVLAALTCVLLASVPARGQVPDPYGSLEVTGDLPVAFPIELPGTQVIVEGVRINGQGPYRFMLDTGGMGGGRVDTSLVKTLDLPVTGEVQASDGTGRGGPTMTQHQLETLELGPLKFTDVVVLSRDYNEFGEVVRGHIDGILGFHLFEELLLTLDYPGSRIIVDKGALPEVDHKTILPLELDNGVPTITIVIDGTPHEAYVDSGSMGPLSIAEAVGDTLTFTGEPQIAGQARTVSGVFDIKSATLDGNAKIGEHTIEQPPIITGAPLRGVNIGGQILQQFTATFDQQNKRAKFVRPHDAEAPKPRKRYGFMIASGQGTGMEIHDTVPGSIAESAGLLAGDVIVSINGILLEDLPVADRGKHLTSSPVTLVIDRQGEQKTFTMSLDDG